MTNCKNCAMQIQRIEKLIEEVNTKDILIEALTEQVNDKDDEIVELTISLEELNADEEDENNEGGEL